jgi:DNA anti-recombination protein RmuC
MTEPTTTSSGSEYRVVTVADLRHELQREHLIINAHLQTISNQVTALDLRFSDFREVVMQSSGEAKDNIDQRFTDMQHHVDQRFAEAKDNTDQRFTDMRHEMNQQFTSIDQRFTSVDQRFAEAKANTDQRFDQMERLFIQVGKRFDALDERLRFNKTLVVASISAVASAASVAVSLLR